MRLYLAGPGIFFPDAQALAARQRALCREYGFTPLHPLDGPPPAANTPEAALAIYRANRARMIDADAILADLTPFRGPSADPGTVFELGFMTALGRPAFAYSHDATLFLPRTLAAFPASTRDTDGPWRDPQGAELEDFGLHDNLMIDAALLDAGLTLHTPPGDPLLAALEAARAHFSRAGLGPPAPAGAGQSPATRP